MRNPEVNSNQIRAAIRDGVDEYHRRRNPTRRNAAEPTRPARRSYHRRWITVSDWTRVLGLTNARNRREEAEKDGRSATISTTQFFVFKIAIKLPAGVSFKNARRTADNMAVRSASEGWSREQGFQSQQGHTSGVKEAGRQIGLGAGG